MLEKTKAIVLHSIRQGESSLIVQCYTERWGRQSFLIKGVRKSKKSNKANLFQPLFLLQLDIYFKPTRDLQWIKEASLVNPLNSLQQDIAKSAQAIFIAEILSRTLKEEEQNRPLFEFLETSINYLDMLDRASASFHLLFLFQFTRHLGFGPQNNYSEERKFFDLNLGTFTNLPNSSDITREEELGKFWRACFTNSYDQINALVNNQSSRNIFLDSILEFYESHMSNVNQIKSLEILRTVFNK
ncbi:DNA repair protein RecO [Bacteroidota bacterium]